MIGWSAWSLSLSYALAHLKLRLCSQWRTKSGRRQPPGCSTMWHAGPDRKGKCRQARKSNHHTSGILENQCLQRLQAERQHEGCQKKRPKSISKLWDLDQDLDLNMIMITNCIKTIITAVAMHSLCTSPDFWTNVNPSSSLTTVKSHQTQSVVCGVSPPLHRVSRKYIMTSMTKDLDVYVNNTHLPEETIIFTIGFSVKFLISTWVQPLVAPAVLVWSEFQVTSMPSILIYKQSAW